MLPSKKILIALAILIVGIGGLALYSYNRGSDTGYDSEKNILAVTDSTNIDNSASKIDSDNDGLTDWEEILYGTNPKVADTDGDGTSDGQEVTQNRNPLVKGPNDFLASKDNPVAASTEKENLTLTDTFARNFFTQYMSIQQSGVTITPDNADQIAGDYLRSATLPAISTKQYSQTDLSLTDSDKAHITTYRSTIAAVFAKYWPTGKNNELAIMQQAFTNNDTKALTGMTSVILSYQNTLDGISKISVPKLAVQLHLNVMNSLATYIQTLKMVQMAFTDPLSGLVGLNSYQTNVANVSVSMANLQMYFINSLK